MKLPIDKEWFEKRAAAEGDLEISAGRLTMTINLSQEEMQQLEQLALGALPQWARDEIIRLREINALQEQLLRDLLAALKDMTPPELSWKERNAQGFHIYHDFSAIVTARAMISNAETALGPAHASRARGDAPSASGDYTKPASDYNSTAGLIGNSTADATETKGRSDDA
jgi:hypothetical protein